MQLAEEARATLERHAQEGMRRLVRGASDAQLERRFGNQVAQRAVFTAMARRFDPKLAHGFEGDIVYELEHWVDGSAPRPPERWTIRVEGDEATVVQGGSDNAAVTLHVSIPDFARVLTGEMAVTKLLMEERFGVEGDLQVASRVGEMFGGPSQF